MRVPEATAWRIASMPECVGAVTDIGEHVRHVGERRRPTNGTPSPPIWVKVRVVSPSSSAMKWQPMPALAKLPSGSLVDVACGQPAQKAGTRFSRPSGPFDDIGGAGARAIQAGGRRKIVMPADCDLGRQFHQRRQQRLAARGGLAADLRALVGGQVIQRVADLRLDEAALFFDHENETFAAGEGRRPSVSSGQVMPIL
jgi:hypothetical protein